jgi:hypothetical protein
MDDPVSNPYEEVLVRCPIKGRTECIGERCSWAYVDFFDGGLRCALAILLEALNAKRAYDSRRVSAARLKLPRSYLEVKDV